MRFGLDRFRYIYKITVVPFSSTDLKGRVYSEVTTSLCDCPRCQNQCLRSCCHFYILIFFHETTALGHLEQVKLLLVKSDCKIAIKLIICDGQHFTRMSSGHVQCTGMYVKCRG